MRSFPFRLIFILFTTGPVLGVETYSSTPKPANEMETMESCIDACLACATACEHCATACLHEEHVPMMVKCIQLDRDCADICRLTAALISRGSVNAPKLAEVCAEVCEACAEECAQHDEEHCQQCAEACRRCAEECRMILNGG